MSEPQPEHGPVSHWGLNEADLSLDVAPSRDPLETVEETKALLGIDVPRRHARLLDRPDVSGLAEGLGL